MNVYICVCVCAYGLQISSFFWPWYVFMFIGILFDMYMDVCVYICIHM